ncbi:MAG: tetratricopeptide repeat protein [Phycisphaerae bacterium]|nr:tetratricopeptide repeat protein [Phycisphaerae bacterium]
MNDAEAKTVCVYCPESGRLLSVAERILRCEHCGFLTLQPLVIAGVAESRVARQPVIAPDGVIRGKYRLIERLGEGAHGVSYLAEHEYLNHSCVVKILPYRAGEASDTAMGRLRREARAGFRVNDPHVVRVLDCDVIRGTWFFVMEYVQGADLAIVLKHKLRLKWQQAAQIGIDAANGLAAIHRLGLVHHDIKPSNLILGTDGRVRVADLGVAGLAEDHGELGQGGTPETVGTLAYTAPETFLPGVAAGHQADLYSLGATLYHLVTGSLPHHGAQVFQRLIDLQCRAVRWPADVGDDVPKWFIEAILRLLAIEPKVRFDSASTLIEHLKATVEQPRPTPGPTLPEILEPRGIGVLPFDNERGTPDDNWLGYALANYVSRALAELPGVYVPDQDRLVELLERLETGDETRDRERLLTAGRMAGAGTVINGRFSREGGTIRVLAEAYRVGHVGSQAVARVEGELADLGELQQALFNRLVRALGLGGAERNDVLTATRSPLLTAQEKLTWGRQAFLRGNYEKAVALAEEAVQLDPEFAEAIGFIGVCLARLGEYDAAETQHHKQEALAQRWGDKRLRVEALANLGVMNYFRGDYEGAEVHYGQAALMAGKLGLAVEEAQIRNNLGFVLFRRGRLAEAEQAFLRAIETHRAYGGLAALGNPYNGMGNVLVEQKRYEEARWYYRRALALAVEIGDRTSVGTTHMHLGHCAALEERFAEAKHEFTMALSVLEETRFWNGLARAYEYIAEMNLRLGNYDETVRCANKRIELARQHSNVRMESAAWLQKAESLELAGRMEEAAACLALGKNMAVPESAGS